MIPALIRRSRLGMALAAIIGLGSVAPLFRAPIQGWDTPDPLTKDERRYRDDLRWDRWQIQQSRRGRRGVSRRVKYQHR